MRATGANFGMNWPTAKRTERTVVALCLETPCRDGTSGVGTHVRLNVQRPDRDFAKGTSFPY